MPNSTVPLTSIENDSVTSSGSNAAAISLAAAEEQYDAALEALLSQLTRDIKHARPANPVAFIRDYLTKSKIEFPDADPGCRMIKDKFPSTLAEKPLTIVVFGASGDLAKKKTFPALFGLYCNGLLPRKGRVDASSAAAACRRVLLNIVGFARTNYTQQEFHDHLRPLLEKSAPSYRCHIKCFLSHIRYVQGDSYSDEKGFHKLDNVIKYHERDECDGGGVLPMDDEAFKAIESEEARGAEGPNKGNRLFYLALPPTAFIETCTAVKKYLVGGVVRGGKDTAVTNSAADSSSSSSSLSCWSRVVVEKPFGHDTASSNALADALNALFTESQIFRIDHYLGKEMVQNVVSLRFANHVFSSVWNRHHIQSVQIVFKEKIGTEGRGGYFDKFGIIRDVIQNHLCQILALVGMEKPRSLYAEDVRDEKVALLRCVEPVAIEDCVIGQYTAAEDGSMKGYKEDDGVPKDSKTPTFAALKLKINNDRWDGVPFILKAGKAVEDKCVTVRVQFRDELRPFGVPVANDVEAAENGDAVSSSAPSARIVGPNRNELVIRAQPDEAMYLKINTKSPGMGGEGDDDDDEATVAAAAVPSANMATSANKQQNLVLTELDLTYGNRFNVRIPEAYESLVNEAILGNSTNFVRRDELDASWRIFTPLLHAIDAGKVAVREYKAGTRGPTEADGLIASTGYRRSRDYFYKKKAVSK